MEARKRENEEKVDIYADGSLVSRWKFVLPLAHSLALAWCFAAFQLYAQTHSISFTRKFLSPFSDEHEPNFFPPPPSSPSLSP